MNFLLKQSLLTAVIILCCITANSQKNFKDGYVVLKTGDTLHGQIDYKNWEINPLFIQFQNGSSVSTYKPAELNYFEITGADKYISSIITKDMRPVDILTLSFRPDDRDTTVTDTAFLRVLVNGKRLKLYGLSDRKNHYYIQKTGTEKMEELVYKKYMSDNNASIVEKTLYRNQLAAFVSEAEAPGEVIYKIEKSQYEEADLVLIVRVLNGEELIAAKNGEAKKKTPIQVLIGAGVVDYSFKFTGQVEKFTSLNFSNGIGPFANIAVDIFSSRNLQKVAIRFGLSYNRVVYNGEVQKNDLLSHPTKYTYKLEQNNIIPAVDFLYHFISHEHFRMYAGIGVGFVFSSYPVNEYRSKVIATGAEEVEEDPIIPEKLWISPNVMVGARIADKINIGILGKVGGGFINYSGIHGTLFPITFSASYIIFSRN